MTTPNEPAPSPTESPPPVPSPAPLAGRAARPGYRRALLATLVWAGVNLIVTLLVSGPPPSPRAAGAFTGALLFVTLVAGLITSRIARRVRPHGWPFWQLLLLALPFYLILRVISSGALATS
jgi:hypothetical protein